jgi:capsular polysaccharide biosynthesis protein
MTPMRTTGVAVATHEAQGAPAESRRSARLSRTQLMIVIASMLVTGALAGVLAAVNPPVFETSRSIIVLSGANPNDNEVITRALESIVQSKGLAAEVKRRGELPQSIDSIAGMISTSRSPESAYMDIIASNPEREVSEAVSAQIVPALTGIFETAQRDLPVESRITGPIFQEVFPRPLQSTSRFPLWFAILFGLLLGGLVPFLFFVVRNLRRPVVESAQDIADALDLPILARVPALGTRGSSAQDSIAGVVAAVERLSLNEPVHRLVLVGADDGRQRAELALGLSCMIARSFGQPVALIDADLDNGVLSSLVGTDEVVGLAECLSGQVQSESVLIPLTDDRLPSSLDGFGIPDGMVRYLSVGVDRSRNILRMRSTFHRVLDDLAGRYVVIVNGPRLPGPVPSSQLLSLADATLMVVAEGRTSITDARSAGDTLRSFAAGGSGVIVVRG